MVDNKDQKGPKIYTHADIVIPKCSIGKVDTYTVKDFKTSKYVISTITATATIGTCIHLPLLFKHIDSYIQNEEAQEKSTDFAITYIEYGRSKNELIYKGDNKKKRKKKKYAEENVVYKAKRFDNQATCTIRGKYNNYINFKIFKNGTIQMTGLKQIDNGEYIIKEFVKVLEEMNETIEPAIVQITTKIETETKDKDGNEINKIEEMKMEMEMEMETKTKELIIPFLENPEKLKASGFSVQLINSDFKINTKINRKILYKLLIDSYENEGYNNKCSFNADYYPGVNLKYYWNISMNNDDRNGNCVCIKNVMEVNHQTGKKEEVLRQTLCKGKGLGLDEGDCKKITIAIFQSGSIIITGARTIVQLETCYDYIIDVIKTNLSQIHLQNIG
jgi:TATA-box binding protein (TBP) (component of TFIID and TFIIIB)